MNIWINDMNDKWDLNDEFIPCIFTTFRNGLLDN